MSLETVIEENNSLLRELIAMWKTGAAPAASPVAITPAPAASSAPAVQAKADAPAVDAPAADAKSASATAEPVTYDQIKPLIIKVNTTKGRDAATALLAEFGVTRGPELKAEQFAKFFARATEVLA